MRTRGLLLVIVAMLLAACGADEPAATSTTRPTSSSTEQATSTTTESETTTTASVTSTSAVAATTTSSLEIDVEFRNGEVSGSDVIRVELGDIVDIWVLSDVDDELHVHGYDVYYDLIAGRPVNLDFVADVPGIFEVEVHTGHTLLFDLEVAG